MAKKRRRTSTKPRTSASGGSGRTQTQVESQSQAQQRRQQQQQQQQSQRNRRRQPQYGRTLEAWQIGALVAGGAALIFLVTAGIGAAVFMAGLVGAVYLVGRMIRRSVEGEPGLVAAQKAVLLSIVFVVPAIFDPRTSDVFAVVKFTVLLFGSTVLLALHLADRALRPRGRRWTALHVAMGVLIAWLAISTIASGKAISSLMGFYSSNNGLLTFAAMAVVFTVAADVFRRSDVRNVVDTLVFAAGGFVVLYGVLQLLDRAADSAGFEPVNWPGGIGVRIFGTTGVWSTFGNPNHFGGFCAILLPLAVARIVVSSTRWERALSAAIAAGALAILGQTASRGAWLAGAVALAIVVLVNRSTLLGYLRRNPKAAALSGVAAVAAAGASANSGLLSKGTSALFELGGTTTIAQRLRFWDTAVRMSGDEPLLGFGLDTFRLAWPHYMDRDFTETFGYALTVTGPHNVFMFLLHGAGWPALLAFLAMLFAGGVIAVRLLRDVEGDDRMLLSAIAAAAVATVVVASFNVERIELTIVLYLALGILVAAYTRADDDAAPRVRRRSGAASPVGIAVTALALLLALPGLWFSTSPWRADLALGRASDAQDDARNMPNETDEQRQAQQARAVEAIRLLEDAVDTNPWESRYHRFRGDQLRGVQNAQGLNESIHHYERALDLTPGDSAITSSLADALFRLAAIEQQGNSSDPVQRGLRLLRADVAREPLNGALRSLYALQLVQRGERDEGLRQIERALDDYPEDERILQNAVQTYEAAGMDDEARAAELRLARVRRASGATTATTTGADTS